MSGVKHMKWWGWGVEGVGFHHEDKPAFGPFVAEKVGLDITGDPVVPPELESLPVPVPKLTDAFLKLDPANPAHKEIMALQRASRFIPTQSSNYDGIEAAAKSAGLVK